MAALATFLVCAGGNVVNDIRDIEIDRVNKPNRVLPGNKVSPTHAFWFSIGCNLLALAVSVVVSFPLFIVAALAIGLLYGYNLKLKRIPLAGNVVIAFLSGLVFITGGIAVDLTVAFELPGPVLGGIFAFLFHLVREIVKDCQDIKGDQQGDVITFPQLVGISKALVVAIGLFFVMTLVTYWPILTNWYSVWYKILTVYCVDLPLLALLIVTYGYPNDRMLAFTGWALKAGMLLGIFALFLA